MAEWNWNVRAAAEDKHWKGAFRVLTSVYIDEIHRGLSQPQEVQQLFSRTSLESHGDLLIATDSNGNVVGAVLLVGQNSRLRQVAQVGEAEFRMLAVESAYRGKGIATALVRECLDRARSRGAHTMVLSTQPFMLAAQRLYEELGFTRRTDRDWTTVGGSPRWVYSSDLMLHSD